MGRLSNSWQSVKASWHVLRQDKELLLFPVISGIASLIVMAGFLVPAGRSDLFERATNQDDPAAQGILIALAYGMTLVLTFITVYFNSALIFAANQRMEGGDPNVGSGLRGANSRFGRIVAWALFAGTVSFLLKALESASRRSRGAGSLVGNILVRIVGVAWTLATYFALPVLVFEDVGVLQSLKRSAQLFKQRWGESLVGEFGIGLAFGAITFVSILVFVLMLFLVMPLGLVGLLALLVLAMFWILLLAVVGSALGVVYKVALYRFATKGQIVPQYPPRLIEQAYRPTMTRAG